MFSLRLTKEELGGMQAMNDPMGISVSVRLGQFLPVAKGSFRVPQTDAVKHVARSQAVIAGTVSRILSISSRSAGLTR